MGAPETEAGRGEDKRSRRRFVNFAFETDRPGDFLDLVMELRGSESSRFTARDTPTFTRLARSLDEAPDSLG